MQVDRLEQREVRWSQVCWAVRRKKKYLEVDQMFQSECRPVGRVEECLGGTQLLQCESR